MTPLVLIDGSGWLFRAYHALPPLESPRGEPTGAIHGFGNMLKKLRKDYAPERLCVVFDPKGRTFRDEMFTDYKANRTATPEELSAQFPSLLEMLEAQGVPVLIVDGVEADDVIGTLAVQARAAGQDVLIVTSDKDMAQLVDEHVKLLVANPDSRIPPAIRDRAGVVGRFGVPPERIIDYLALIGDSSDNIPGVPLVGPKTATKWLGEYGTLDGVIAAATAIPGKAGENLRAHLSQLDLARRLATIRCDVALPLAWDALVPKAANAAKLLEMYQRFGFHRWIDELSRESKDEAPAAAPPPATDSPPTRAELVLDETALRDLVAKLEAAPLIAIHMRADGADPFRARLIGLALATEAGHGWYVPVAHDYLGAPLQLTRAAVLDALRPLLERADKAKLGHDLKHDVNLLARHGVAVSGVAHDTMLESYVLDATGNRHELDTLAQKYLNHTLRNYEDIAGRGKAQLTFNQIALDHAAAIAAEVADVTLRLHRALLPKIAALETAQRVYTTIEMPLEPVLARMELAGVRVDGALLGEIARELARRMDEIQGEAFREAGGEFNMGSPKQLQQILYERMQLPVLGKTPKGDPSTAEDVLEELAAAHRLPRLILDWRALQKLRSTYAEQLPQAIDGTTKRVHTTYAQAVAATGRLSSQDPNLQNIPVRTAEGRRIRQAFVPEAGNLLLSIDYSQIELRLMAHLSGDERLQDAFRRGFDVHQATAAEIFGLPIESVGPDQRRAAKAINFGLIYGMSAFGLSTRLAIPRAEAIQYMERFFGRYAGVRQYMDRTKATAREAGFVETLFGRRLYLPQIRSKNAVQRAAAERVAINAPLQGTAADLIKLAMIDADAFVTGSGVRMIMQVHDELVFEGPAGQLTELAPVIAQRMCAITPLSVPLVADFGLGSNWDSAHSGQGHASS